MSDDIKAAISSLESLLDDEVREEDVQKHLERHPWMVPGNTRISHDIVISKLPLAAEHKVDFAYLFSNSSGNYVQLIEIERPGMKVFNEDDEFSQDYNHAFGQVTDWTEWAKRNLRYLDDILTPFRKAGFESPSHVRCTLIAGRRSNVQANLKRQRKWMGKVDSLDKRYTIRTYDGFIEEIAQGQYLDSGKSISDIKCVAYRDQAFVEKFLKDNA